MSRELRYGVGRSIALEAGVWLCPDAADDRHPGGSAEDDHTAITAAFERPLSLPALSRCVTPADRIALVIDPQIPRRHDLAAAIAKYFLDRTAQPEDLAIVGPHGAFSAEKLARRLGGAKCEVVEHRPDDPSGRQYLANTAEGEPVYLDRAVAGADFVLCVSLARSPGAWKGRRGESSTAFDPLYPALADAETQARLSHERHKRRPNSPADETSEVVWLLGLQALVQVVPGADGAWNALFAGAIDDVVRKARSQAAARWRMEPPRQWPLIVAGLSGGAMAQTWTNVARVVDQMGSAVVDGGTLAICTSLSHKPTGALKRLDPAIGYDELARHLAHDASESAVAALTIAEACERIHVQLLSELPAGAVESHGLGAIETPETLAKRVARLGEDVAVVPDSQFAVLAGEWDAPDMTNGGNDR